MRSPRLTDAAAGVALVLFPLAVRAHEVAHPAPDTRIVSNDNRRPAGTLRNGVLTVRIDARDGTWTPDGSKGRRYSVAAFGEVGKTATDTGSAAPRSARRRGFAPTVRNTLGKTLWMYGLGAKRGVASDSSASRRAPRTSRSVRPNAPGLFYYAGRTVAPRSLHAAARTANYKASSSLTARARRIRSDLHDSTGSVPRHDDPVVGEHFLTRLGDDARPTSNLLIGSGGRCTGRFLT